MDISCDIIRDLLPLYAEDLVSEDSKKLVDEHLSGCDDCTKLLGKLKKETPLTIETDTHALNHVRRTIIRRRGLSIVASVLTLITIAGFVVSYLFAPFQLTAEQALDDFYVREDGAVVIDYSSAVVGRSRAGHNENWFLIQYSTRYDMWKGNNRKSLEQTFGADGIITEEERLRYENIDICRGHWETADGRYHSDDPNFDSKGEEWVFVPESNWNFWYSDPYGLGEDVMLHDAGKEAPLKEDRYTFAPIYPMLFFGGILAVLALYLLRKVMKKPWMRELAARLAILCGSAVVSLLLVSSGRIFTSPVGIIDQYWGPMIGTNTVFLTLTILFWRQLHKLNKQDKGL